MSSNPPTLQEAMEKIERLEAELEQSERVIQAKMECIDEQAMQIKQLQAEVNTLSLMGKRKTWKPDDGHDNIWHYGSLILLLNHVGETRKWVSKKNEPPSMFLARILNEKQWSNGQWLEYLIDELDLVNRAKMECIDEMDWYISSLKCALVEERARVLAFTPDEIEWRTRNNMPDVKDEGDWETYIEAAKKQLREEGLLWQK